MVPKKIIAVFTVVLFASSVNGDEGWSRFRGPNGTGVSEATSVPVKWTDEDYNWGIDLPGKGHSSPVIWGERLFITSCEEDSNNRLLLCIDTTSGKLLWTKSRKFNSYKKHKNNSYASSTPCVDNKHVYVAWHSKKSSQLLAFDHDGNEIWNRELAAYTHGQGGATSPIVYRDLVVLTHDQKQPSFLLAVNRNTGEEVWKVDREGKRACYSTPCIFQRNGTDELVFTHCYEGIVGVNPKTGEQNWHIDVFGRASQRALSSPIVAGDLVMATSGGVGGETQLVAVRPAQRIGGETRETWRTNKQTPHVPTPIVWNDRLFMWSDKGIASCLDSKTGELIWKERVGGNYFGSPICVNGKLYCIDLDGTVVVIAAADEYKLFGKVSLGEGSKATPAVSGGVMYLRTESRLLSLGG